MTQIFRLFPGAESDQQVCIRNLGRSHHPLDRKPSVYRPANCYGKHGESCVLLILTVSRVTMTLLTPDLLGTVHWAKNPDLNVSVHKIKKFCCTEKLILWSGHTWICRQNWWYKYSQMKHIFKSKLVVCDLFPEDPSLPSPDALKKKILVKNKKILESK